MRACAAEDCEATFVPTRSTQLFHKRSCAVRTANRRRGSTAPTEKRRCAFPGCSVEFVPIRETQIYHDSLEGTLASRARARGSASDLPNAPAYVPARAAAPRYPEGWEPGVRLDGASGHIVTRPTADREPRFEEHLKSFGFDPDEYEIVEPIQVRTWDAIASDGDRESSAGTRLKNPNRVVQLWYYRANIRRRTKADPDVKALIEEIRRHKPRKLERPAGEDAFVVAFADWQLGKKDGDGVEGTVQRILADIDSVVERALELRKLGRPLGALYLADMGDIFEACFGFYPMQSFRVELDRRQQKRLGRRLFTQAIKAFAPHFERVVVLGVPGNHGENRQDGKAVTSFGDNDDVAVVEELAEIFAENPEAYGHVSFVAPEDDLVVTLRIAGQIVAFAHGHQAKGGASIDAKVERWWKGQQHGMRPAGDATILFTGHYHHLRLVQNGPRTWFQCPSLEGGSQWWEETSGESAPKGTLTVRITPDGWSDLEVV